MKRFGVVSGAFLLFVLLGATAFGYAQQEQQSEKQTNQEKQAKPEQQHAQPQQQHAQQPQQNQNKQDDPTAQPLWKLGHSRPMLTQNACRVQD